MVTSICEAVSQRFAARTRLPDRAWGLGLVMGALLAGFFIACIGDIDDGDCEALGTCGTEQQSAPTSSNCNPLGEPTWDAPVGKIMADHCRRCHGQCSSYDNLGGWIRDGSLQSCYRESGIRTVCYTDAPNHYAYGDDHTQLLRWIELGYPETDCDVPVQQ